MLNAEQEESADLLPFSIQHSALDHAASFGVPPPPLLGTKVAVISPEPPWPNLMENSAVGPWAVERTAVTWYVTPAVAALAGSVASVKLLGPVVPMIMNGPAPPICRPTWYSVPVEPRGFLHFQVNPTA